MKIPLEKLFMFMQKLQSYRLQRLFQYTVNNTYGHKRKGIYLRLPDNFLLYENLEVYTRLHIKEPNISQI